MLQAIVETELNIPFIPMDQARVEDSGTTLYLPSGDYLLRLVNKEDRVLEEQKLKVP